MTRSLPVLSTFLLVVLAGCSDGSGDAAAGASADAFERRSGSFLDAYRASLSTPSTTKSLDISGDWYGVLFCPSGAYPVEIQLGQSGMELSGEASIGPAIGNARHTTPFHADHRGRAGSGEYRPEQQVATLEAAPDPDADPRKARGLHLSLLLSPGRGDRALLAARETSAARSRRACLDGIAARGEAAEILQAQVAKIATLAADRRPVVQGECPAAYRRWLTGMSPRGELAFDDAAFVEAFGRPYLELDAEALLQAAAVISGSCADMDDRRRQIQVNRIGADLRHQRNFQNALHTAWRDAVWSAWLGWFDDALAGGVAFDATAAGELRRMPHDFNLRQTAQWKAFDARVASLFDQGRSGARNLAFAEQLEAAKDDFVALLGLHEQAVSRGDIDMDMVRTALDYYLADAAGPYAQRAADVAAGVYMSAWIARQRDGGACPAASAQTCERVIETFDERLESLAETLADVLDAAFAQIAEQDEGLEQLAAMVEFEQRQQRSHGLLMNHRAFEDGIEARREARRELQDDLDDDLLALVGKARTAPALHAIETTYYQADDLQSDAAEDVREAIATRLADTRPFASIFGSDYFNALYNRDYQALRDLDRRYLQGIRPLVEFGSQQVIAMAPLLDAVAGRKGKSVAAEYYRGLQNLTALYAVLGTYLLEYQDVYADCLKPNAVTLEITERVDHVTRDGFGNVIRRREGWTNRDYYKINPEFRKQFTALFEAARQNEIGRLLDLFANDAQILRLRDGTRSLMRKHACDSPQIKQFETGLLAYDREIKRRVRGR